MFISTKDGCIMGSDDNPIVLCLDGDTENFEFFDHISERDKVRMITATFRSQNYLDDYTEVSVSWGTGNYCGNRSMWPCPSWSKTAEVVIWRNNNSEGPQEPGWLTYDKVLDILVKHNCLPKNVTK